MRSPDAGGHQTLPYCSIVIRFGSRTSFPPELKSALFADFKIAESTILTGVEK